MFWKDSLSKNVALEMNFLVLSGKMLFLSSENMILLIRRKIKDHLSQKIHGNMISVFGKDGDGISFSYKNDFALLSKKQR